MQPLGQRKPTTVKEWLECYREHIGVVANDEWTYLLWKHTWAGGKPIVTEEDVIRPTGHSDDIIVPKKRWVITGFSDQFSPFRVTKALVRNDYANILNRIINLSTGGESTGPGTSNDSVDVDNEEVNSVCGDIQPPIPAECSIADIHLRDMNSFAHQMSVVVTGSPGNGKSIFLHLFLGLRLRAKLPTLLQLSPDDMFMFTEYGPCIIKSSATARMALQLGGLLAPIGGWFLTDSTSTLKEPSTFAQYSGLPVLQTPSPRKDRFHWINKYTPAHYLVVTPFTLIEALMVRDLQTMPNIPSEAQLVDWFRDLVPSVRLAFAYAKNRARYEVGLLTRLNSLSAEDIRHLAMNAQAIDGDISDSLLHEIFILKSVLFYSMWEAAIATPYLTQRLVEGMHLEDYEQRLRTYKIFLGIPSLASATGKLLEMFVRERLSSGGVWELVKLKTEKVQSFSHWVIDQQASSLIYLVLGGPTSEVLTTSKPSTTSAIKTFSYDKLNPGDLEAGTLYLPNKSNQATFDAFFYTGDTAVLFQVTVKKDKHGVNKDGLEMMDQLVKQKIYIGIVPPNYETVFTINPKVEAQYANGIEKFLMRFTPSQSQ